jgi:hypothetical protein
MQVKLYGTIFPPQRNTFEISQQQVQQNNDYYLNYQANEE